MTSVRRLAAPRRARVSTDAEGAPVTVDGEEVDGIRETWLLEDRWWTEEPLRRRYWEVITTSGSDQVVFHDLIGRGWWSQR
jgi:hypothetical protein